MPPLSGAAAACDRSGRHSPGDLFPDPAGGFFNGFSPEAMALVIDKLDEIVAIIRDGLDTNGALAQIREDKNILV
ncbi:MAG: hypothetical protein WCO89_13850 [Syntrophus sp. (in: bacteria)]